MGLDMYLYKCESVSGKHLKRTQHTFEEVMYWRKAHDLHRWFIDNCGNGETGLDMYEVSSEQLGELLERCFYLFNHRDKIPDSEFSIETIIDVLNQFEDLDITDGWYVYIPSY